MSSGPPVGGPFRRAQARPPPTPAEYTVSSTVVPDCRRRTRTLPFGRELFGRATARYSVPDPHAPSTCVVNVYRTTILFPLTRTRSHPARLTEVAVGFASAIHSGVGAGETSLMTTVVAARAATGKIAAF